MKAVFFDFDGTLTFKGPNIWKSIWAELGYNTDNKSEYKRQLDAFLTGKITYQEWCNETLQCYLAKGMDLATLNKVSKDIRLMKIKL